MSRNLVLAVLCVTFPEPVSPREAAILRFAAQPSSPEQAVLTVLDSTEPAQVLPVMRTFLATSPRPPMSDTQRAAIAPACPSAQYRPAPWLSLAAEQRRLRYHAAIQLVACEIGLPANLLDALVGQESAYRHDAVSKAGAAGLTQLMPATARSLGIRHSFDPWLNLRGGARYLRQQMDRFKRVDLALAAYNAGPERRSLAGGKIPPIAETRAYVRSVIQRWGQLANDALNGDMPKSWPQDNRVPDQEGQESGVEFAVYSRE